MNGSYLYKVKRIHWEELPKDEQWVYGYVRGFNECKELIHVWEEMNSSTLCRCTGSKDKNGNLIWENDLVLTTREDGYSLICWNDTEARWEMHNEMEGIVSDFDNYRSNEVEVRGNKFDNPELLE